MSFLTAEDILHIDFTNNVFDIEAADSQAETVYNGAEYADKASNEKIEEHDHRD